LPEKKQELEQIMTDRVQKKIGGNVSDGSTFIGYY
jgi:hypothetical protein